MMMSYDVLYYAVLFDEYVRVVTEHTHFIMIVNGFTFTGPVVSEIAEKLIRNPNNPAQEETGKMDTARFSSLAVKGVYYKLSEMWIAQQPFLVITYFAVYMPALFRWLNVYVSGPVRVAAITEGKNVFDVAALFGLK